MELKQEVASALAAALGTPFQAESGMKKHKVISNRDGCSGRREETYGSYEPCSYRVENQHGVKVGEIHQMARWNPRRELYWFAYTEELEGLAFQYLVDAKRYVTTGEQPGFFCGYPTYDQTFINQGDKDGR